MRRCMIQPELQFRPALPGDHDALMAIRPAYTEFAAKRFLEAACNTPELNLYIAEQSHEPVGTIMVLPKDTTLEAVDGVGYTFTVPEGPHTVAWLDDLCVTPRWQGKGIASAIIAEGLRKAQDVGYDSVEGRTAQPLPEHLVTRLGLIACGQIILPDGTLGYNYTKHLQTASLTTE